MINLELRVGSYALSIKKCPASTTAPQPLLKPWRNSDLLTTMTIRSRRSIQYVRSRRSLTEMLT